MERGDRSGIATFVTPEPLSPGAVSLGEEAAHHARVRRLDLRARVRLVDGQGGRASGEITRIARRDLVVDAGPVTHEDAPPPVHLLVPIADKERMLWLAEKCTELAATSWRPVLWSRSRSVSPRGEGMTFQQKVRARMGSALEQSGGAWMPVLYPEATIGTAIAASPPGLRLLLDASGPPILGEAFDGAPVSIAVGPEGGIEDHERSQFIDAGFRPASLGATVLRFETAGVTALGIARAALAQRST